eukprot:s92_g24.t1
MGRPSMSIDRIDLQPQWAARCRPFLEWFDAHLMGVRGLYTLATEQQALWRRMSRDEWPVLVVDGGSFRHEMCRNFYFGSRHGGDLWSLQQALEKFLSQLMEWGWELIFVFDGISPEWKEATWRQRTEADFVRADKDARGVAEWDDSLPPIFSGLVLSITLLKLGVATVQADEDADGAVVGIAREKNGMVVSRDSDLMLMDSRGYIDMPQFFEYGLQREDGLLVLEPARLWQYLGICGDEVSLFASLCGNDFVGHEEMRPWHNLLRSGAKQHDTIYPLAVSFIHDCKKKGMDLLEAVKGVVPASLHPNLEYSILHFYEGTFDEGKSTLVANGDPVSGPMLARWRAGELSGAMMSAASRGFLALPAVVEEARQSCGWLLSRPLRAAAAKLLPRPVMERLRQSNSTKIQEVLLNAPALEPPFCNWPLGVDNATLELRKEYFRQAVDWGQLEEDCQDLPEELILPVCCMRFLTLVNAESESSVLDIPWPYLGAWLWSLALSREEKQQVVADVQFNPAKVYCPAGASFINAYLTSLWSVHLLNGALGMPYGSFDPMAYDGPFLHGILWCLHGSSPRAASCFSKDDKDRTVLQLPPDALFSALLAIFQGVEKEVGQTFSGKVSARKLKFTMPGEKKPKAEKTTAKKSTNAFDALRLAAPMAAWETLLLDALDGFTDLIRCNKGISACGKSKEWPVALLLLKVMGEIQLPADNFSYNAAISACGKGSAWEKALELFRETPERDVISFNSAIDACKRGDNWQMALSLLEQMSVELGVRSLNGQNACIGACHVGNQWQLALLLFNDLRADKQQQPNTVSHSCAMSACESQGQWQLALSIFNLMSETQAKRDALIFNVAMYACRHAGQRPSQLRSNVVSFSSLLASSELPGRWELALGVIDVMRGEGRC